MPPKDRYNEVLILGITGIIVLLVLTGLVVFILLFYQKKKFQHREQLTDMEKQYSEELLKSQLELQEQTFNSISQEIHDNVGQMLSLAKVQLNILDQGETLNREMVKEIKANIGKAMGDLRDIAHSLSTERVKLVGLLGTIKGELYRVERSGLMAIDIQVHGTERDLEDKKKLIIFRIVQESLQNIIKHANATNITVDFRFDAASILIEVVDNGKGFDTDDAIRAKVAGLGLRNIVGRAAMIGGRADIRSTFGQGTTISIRIPYAQ